MKFPFKSDYGLIYVAARLQGKTKNIALILALDTGATGTVISARRLNEAGYELQNPEDEVYITTGSGLISVPKIMIEKLTALGKTKENFSVIAHDLPPTASVDDVLGLDFLREKVLTIDFEQGQIELK
ncbi:MAG TPA: retropepsin-like aspartic protease [Pyrinomonadaceae bacterium]|nr:retropepsin-like aspartic protease [Pyrinomonadaceae bacterium]